MFNIFRAVAFVSRGEIVPLKVLKLSKYFRHFRINASDNLFNLQNIEVEHILLKLKTVFWIRMVDLLSNYLLNYMIIVTLFIVSSFNNLN